MANMMFYNAYVMINSVDLSAHVRSVKLNYEANMLDDTMMGDATKSNKPGLKNWSVDIEFEQDYASGQVDATLFPLVGAAAFAISFRPDAAVQGSTNPTFAGNAVLENYNPMGGSVGELHMTSVTFRCAGALSRTAT
jgi:hypothetical protein